MSTTAAQEVFTAPPTLRRLSSALQNHALALAAPDNLGLQFGARIVATPKLDEILRDVPRVLGRRQWASCDAPSGCGKTLLQWLVMARASQLGYRVARIQLDKSVRGDQKEVVAEIFRQITAGDERTPRTRILIIDRLRQLLAPPNKVLILWDELPRLQNGADLLKYLHDEVKGDFPLWVSGVGMTALLEADEHLRRRVKWEYEWTQLDPVASVQFAQLTHPALRSADKAVLKEVEAVWASGRPARWHIFLGHALDRMEDTGAMEITAPVAYAALGKKVSARVLEANWQLAR